MNPSPPVDLSYMTVHSVPSVLVATETFRPPPVADLVICQFDCESSQAW